MVSAVHGVLFRPFSGLGKPQQPFWPFESPGRLKRPRPTGRSQGAGRPPPPLGLVRLMKDLTEVQSARKVDSECFAEKWLVPFMGYFFALFRAWGSLSSHFGLIGSF